MSKPDRLRLFIAVRVPEEQLMTLQEMVAVMRVNVSDARWTEIENQHVTLKFLGSTLADLVDDVGAVIEGVARRAAPGQVSLARFGAFPNSRRARVFWTGIDDPAGLLPSMAQELHERLKPVGFEPEKRPLTPHVTLARLRNPRNLVADMAELAPLKLPSWSVESLDLFLSRLSPKGARYELMKAYALNDEKSDN